MIIKLDFGNDFVQYVSVKNKEGRKINVIACKFLQSKNVSISLEEYERMTPEEFDAFTKESHTSWDGHLFVSCINKHHRNAKAKLLETPPLKKERRTVYF